MNLLVAAGVAFLVSGAATPLVRSIGRRAGVIDKPNERSSHQVPTPRGGGIAILAGIFGAAAVGAVFSDQFWLIALVTTMLVAIAGFIDDVRSLGAGVRFLTHCAAAIVPVLFVSRVFDRLLLPWGAEISLAIWLAVPLLLLFVVGLTNAYNFMDGINGIASLEAIVAACTFAVLFVQQGDMTGAAMAAGTAGAAAGFLPWNFPSASLFMGDVGSGALGFLFAMMMLRFAAPGGEIIPAILPLLPFILDTGVTLTRRIARGERFYAAHRSHYYQRLTALGWSHVRVTLLWGGLAAVGGVVGAAYEWMSPTLRLVAVGVFLVLQVLVAVAITRGETAAG